MYCLVFLGWIEGGRKGVYGNGTGGYVHKNIILFFFFRILECTKIIRVRVITSSDFLANKPATFNFQRHLSTATANTMSYSSERDEQNRLQFNQVTQETLY